MLIKLLIQSIVYIITSRRVVLLLTLPINISCCVSLCHNSLYVWSRWIDKFNLLTHLIIWQVILASWCSVTVIFFYFLTMVGSKDTRTMLRMPATYVFLNAFILKFTLARVDILISKSLLLMLTMTKTIIIVQKEMKRCDLW